MAAGKQRSLEVHSHCQASSSISLLHLPISVTHARLLSLAALSVSSLSSLFVFPSLSLSPSRLLSLLAAPPSCCYSPPCYWTPLPVFYKQWQECSFHAHSTRFASLFQDLDYDKVLSDHLGIAHTRWATHGPPNEVWGGGDALSGHGSAERRCGLRGGRGATVGQTDKHGITTKGEAASSSSLARCVSLARRTSPRSQGDTVMETFSFSALWCTVWVAAARLLAQAPAFSSGRSSSFMHDPLFANNCP